MSDKQLISRYLAGETPALLPVVQPADGKHIRCVCRKLVTIQRAEKFGSCGGCGATLNGFEHVAEAFEAKRQKAAQAEAQVH